MISLLPPLFLTHFLIASAAPVYKICFFFWSLFLLNLKGQDILFLYFCKGKELLGFQELKIKRQDLGVKQTSHWPECGQWLHAELIPTIYQVALLKSTSHNKIGHWEDRAEGFLSPSLGASGLRGGLMWWNWSKECLSCSDFMAVYPLNMLWASDSSCQVESEVPPSIYPGGWVGCSNRCEEVLYELSSISGGQCLYYAFLRAVSGLCISVIACKSSWGVF